MDVVEFLTSKEIVGVYIVTAVACLLCFIIYLVDKYNDRGRKRHNTKELNKLVEQIKEEVDVTLEEETSEPVLQLIEEATPIVENKTYEDYLTYDDINKIVQEISTEVIQEITTEATIEEKEANIEILEEELQYTSIELDRDVAREELQRITEELKEQQEEVIDVIENAALTSYELEQEENAIISLEELVKKSKEMYEANELTQYKDEGNEPISIGELEVISGREAQPITSPFEISKLVSKEEKVVLDDFETIKTEVLPEAKKFKSSPIISPIYGIEKQESIEELELENTADYDKLDAEIKKTNEFLMTLKELQNKLD